MPGILHQINTGNGGVPKHPVPSVRVTYERLEGDDWTYSHNRPAKKGIYRGHGGREKAVCLYSIECLEKLQRQGFRVFPGALGENFTTFGLDSHQVRIGDIYSVGDEVTIQITQIRTPCGTIRKAYSPQAPKREGIEAALWDERVKKNDVTAPKWGMTGFYGRVLREGVVHTRDLIECIAESASFKPPLQKY